MDTLQKLAAQFERFPGIGPRQAQRFVQHLLRMSALQRKDIADMIGTLSRNISQCTECQRFHEGERGVCNRCKGPGRDRGTLMVVAHDADADAVERTHTYHGTYFIFGGMAILGNETQPHLHEALLRSLVSRRLKDGLKEIILAFPANPEGDATAAIAKDAAQADGITVTMLGRGLSTGSELEYADPSTIKNALDSRH